MDAFASVLRDVPGGVRTRFAPLDIDDKRIAGNFQPDCRQRSLFDPSTFTENVHVRVPAVRSAATLDLDEEDTASLGFGPCDTSTQFREGSVESIDILGNGVIGLAERQSDQSEFPTFGKGAHAGSDMSRTFSGAWLTESISASVAGNSIHVGIIDGSQHPSMTAASIEASTTILRFLDRFQRTCNTTTAVSPSGVTEEYTDIGERILRAIRRSLSDCLRRCFEAIELIGTRVGGLCKCVGFTHCDCRAVGWRGTRSLRTRQERAVCQSLATSCRLRHTASIGFHH